MLMLCKMSLSYLQYAYRYSGSAKGRFVNLKNRDVVSKQSSIQDKQRAGIVFPQLDCLPVDPLI